MKEKEERNYTVYKHTSPSGKIYIGMTCQKPKRRWKNGNGYSHNKYFTNAINKYGWDNFTHEILFENLTQEEAEQMEIELIKLHKSNNLDFGYNIQNGGNYAGKHSEETRKKMSKIHKGKKLSDETKEKLRKINRGKIWTDEEKRRISELMTGDKNPNSKKIYCNNLIFSCIRECSDYLNISISTISCWLGGHREIPKEIVALGLHYATAWDIKNYPIYDKNIHKTKTIDRVNPKMKKIYCDNIIFISMKKCSEYYKINYNTMKSWLQGVNNMPQKFKDLGLRWATEEDINTYPIYKN